jgi:hypothetical protein
MGYEFFLSFWSLGGNHLKLNAGLLYKNVCGKKKVLVGT